MTSRLTHHRLPLGWAVRCAVWLMLTIAMPLTAQAAEVVNLARDCKTRAGSTLSHFWELSTANDCDTFRLRGYKPVSVMGVFSDGVNKQPLSTAANRSAITSQDYQRHEGLLQLSIRTKLATGLLPTDPGRTDGLWFGYTQKSFWQVLSRGLSRPFRTTDHEPELAYIYPVEAAVGMGFTARYAGLSLNHQSNGQAAPYSRSWNRVILMAGADRADGSQLNVRIWKRMSENPSSDDNPDIANYIGRAEVSALWPVNPKNSLGLSVRHNLRREGHGSGTVDWYIRPGVTLSNPNAGLRYHLQLFSGHGDSLASYNFKRTSLRFGVSLVDW